MAVRALIASALLACACEDFGALGADKPRRFTLSIVDTFHTDAGDIFVPLSPDAGDIYTFVRTDDGWQSVQGDWVDAGLVDIRNVPPGYALVGRPDRGFLMPMSGDSIDLGNDFLGPPAPLAGDGTGISFNATMAVAPDSRTYIAASAVGDAFVEDNILSEAPLVLFMPYVDPADPTAPDFVWKIDWAGLRHLENEPVRLYEFTTTDVSPGVTRWTASLTAMTQVTTIEGSETTAVMRLGALPSGTNVPATTFNLTNLNAVMTQMGWVPNPTNAMGLVRTMLDTDGYNTALPVQMTTLGAGGTAQNPGITGDPLPERTWQPLVEGGVYVQSALGVGDSAPVLVLSATNAGPYDSPDWPFRTVGPVINPVVTDDGSGPASPQVSWTAPGLGSPSVYSVLVVELMIDTMNNVTYAPQLMITTTETSVHIPPQDQGVPLFFVIDAEDCGAYDPSAPFRTHSGTTCARASNRTAVYTPPTQ